MRRVWVRIKQDPISEKGMGFCFSFIKKGVDSFGSAKEGVDLLAS
jgi:hypothetical protein